ARAGRRDYSRLPRLEVLWDFPDGGYCCPECGEPFTPLGDHWSGEQLDWQVIVRLVAHCRRRYRRACDCRVPATVMAPGPPKAVGKGLLSNGFIAMLLTERFAAGRSMNSLVTGLGRQGAEISPATLAGTCAQAGALLAPVADAITERSRGSWHLHADETTWRVFAPREGGGPAKWWLWVFLGPDTVCCVMDPTRSGDANPVQLKYWTDAWLDRIRDLYAAHDGLMAAWQENAAPAPQERQAAAARLEDAYAAWDDALAVIDEARKKQAQAPGLAEPAK